MPEGVSQHIELRSTPYYDQQNNFCGPSSLASVLDASGVAVDDFEKLVNQVYLPGKRGTLQVELLAATRRYRRIPYVIQPRLESLIAELEAGRPAVVLQNLTPLSTPRWHYAVVIGFDRSKNQMILRSGSHYRMTVSTYRFAREWERAGNWGFIVLRPGELPAANDAPGYLKAVFDFQNVSNSKAVELAYKSSVKRWPEQEVAWIGLTEAQYKNGDLQGAVKTLRGLLKVQPNSVAAYNNLALLLNETGCVSQARSTLRKAIDMAREQGHFLRQVEDTRRKIEKSAVESSEHQCAIN